MFKLSSSISPSLSFFFWTAVLGNIVVRGGGGTMGYYREA